ncbi:MAG: TIGR02646 family protein [Candidatus Aminicenantes bacterium]|nr:TIGR02646 family protein [Candidatus Aminicenantes bacterium]
MLKIKKVEKPDFFNKWIKNNKGYSLELRKYLLAEEQWKVCCYCEKTVSESPESSHIDHIRPKDKFPDLIHDYDNLTVSCQTKKRCGHAKGNKFDENFIVPTEDSPGDYLTYSPNGEIRPVENNKRGRETIDILHLNAPKLRPLSPAHVVGPRRGPCLRRPCRGLNF